MKILDLFSGIGGFSLGLDRAGMETVAFCEQDKFCQKVLAKHWPGVPIFDDVRTLDGTQFRGSVDLVCGGFPCQPFSVAGKQEGNDGPRHLWPDMLRIIREVRPTWVIGENVSGFVNMALDAVCADLESEGYQVQSFLIPACGVEAHHRRERCWIVAYTERNGCATGTQRGGITETAHEQSPRQDDALDATGAGCVTSAECDVANTESERVQGLWSSGQQEPDPHGPAGLPVCEGQGTGSAARDAESRLGGTVDGLPDWLDGFEYIGNPDRFGVPRVTTRKTDRAARIKALGNAVVPQIPEIIGRAIMEAVL